MKNGNKLLVAWLSMFLTVTALSSYYENEYFLSGMATAGLIIWFGYMIYEAMRY